MTENGSNDRAAFKCNVSKKETKEKAVEYLIKVAVHKSEKKSRGEQGELSAHGCEEIHSRSSEHKLLDNRCGDNKVEEKHDVCGDVVGV